MNNDVFYVGYLPLPGALKWFLRVLVPVLVIIVLAVAAINTSQQNQPGDGVWALNEVTELTGRLMVEPYPMLLTEDGQASALLVGQTKHAVADDLVATHADQMVRVTGTVIARHGQRRLIVPVTIQDANTPVQALPQPVAVGEVTLDGQIIDPKCYFGAMKPGEGKVHKACATLCISGGIPPMFMMTDADGSRTFYLLTNAKGEGIAGDELSALLPYVADPVQIMGRVERWGGVMVIRMDVSSIRRR